MVRTVVLSQDKHAPIRWNLTVTRRPTPGAGTVTTLEVIEYFPIATPPCEEDIRIVRGIVALRLGLGKGAWRVTHDRVTGVPLPVHIFEAPGVVVGEVP